MSTLTTPPLSTLLARLFADAETTDQPIRQRLAAMAPDERSALMRRANTDYRDFYGSQAKTLFLPVSRETGKLLYLLARSSKARTIVEFGTSFGISTLHLAAAIKDNGGGRLIGSEFVPEKAARAREHIAEAGLSEFVEIREGDALESLARDLPETIDLVLLDGTKVLYPRILSLLEPKLAPNALLVADNADDSPEYLDRVRNAASGYVSVPFASDVELSMRVSATA